MQAIDVVCFLIIVGGSILIIEIVFAGSNEKSYIHVGFPSVLLSSRAIFVFENFAIYNVVHGHFICA